MNHWQLSFAERLSYKLATDIIVPVSLSADRFNTLDLYAKFDTGSTFCVFPRRHAEWLGLDVESGAPQWIGTAMGSFLTYGHEVTLSTCGIEWQAVVFFAESDAFNVEVVGRVGFIDRLRIGLIDFEQELYLSPYDE